jgi:hypothetical protein
MTDTTFVAGETRIRADWLNYVNDAVNYLDTQEVYLARFSGYNSATGADNTAVLAAAHAFAASLPLGATLVIPPGNMTVTALPAVRTRVNWRGYGRLSSQIVYTGTGDGIAYNTATVNTYDQLRIFFKDFTLSCSNAGNTGAGFKFNSAAYIKMENVIIEKFKYGLQLDGTAHFWMSYCEFLQQTRASIWIVNGVEVRPTQLQGFTNNLWFGPEIQINNNAVANAYAVADDGGVNHHYWGVNFNAGDIGARFCGVRGLIYHNNPHESYLQTPLQFTNTTREGAVLVGACKAVDVRGCTFSNNTPFAVRVESLDAGVFEANAFAVMTSSCFDFGTNISDVRIAKNSKFITGSGRSAVPFFNSSLAPVAAGVDVVDQAANTYVAASLVAGQRTVTPATMEMIYPGDTIYCANADGVSAGSDEYVIVESVTATNFIATFAKNKIVNWTIRGQGARYTKGTWTPTLAGSTVAGAHTYTLQQGTWKRDKATGLTEVSGTLTVSVVDAAMAGAVEIAGLPFKAQNTTANLNGGASINFWTGITLPAGYTHISGLIGQNANKIGFRRGGSGVAGATMATAEFIAPVTVSFVGFFYTH